MDNNSLRIEVKVLKAKGVIKNCHELAELMGMSKKSFYNWLCGCYEFGYVKQELLESIINKLTSDENKNENKPLENIDIQWKDIQKYPNYKISNTGLVLNTKTNRILKGTDKGSYRVVQLTFIDEDGNIKQKNIRIDKLMSEVF